MNLAADLMNPLLVACGIAAPFLVRKRPAPVWVRTLAGLGFVYLLTGADRWLGIWSAFGGDFSTHTAFFVTVGTGLVVTDRRWLYGVVPLAVVYAVLMVRLEYHTWLDIGTSAAAVLPVAILCQRAYLR